MLFDFVFYNDFPQDWLEYQLPSDLSSLEVVS
jgi:hypothetical protein